MNEAADGRWLTYAELAQSRGITKASAARLVRRNKWRKQADNQGNVRVFVPGEIEPADTEADSLSAMAVAINALQEALSVERTRVDQAEARAARADTMADKAAAAADQAQSRADQAEAEAAQLRK